MAVTIDDLAQETGYHRSTVSQVLNGDKRCFASAETRRIIRQAARRHSFVPNYFARSLRKRESRTVGIVMQVSEFADAQISPLVEALFQKGYMPLFCESLMRPELEARAVQALCQRFVDGLVIQANTDGTLWFEYLRDGLPCVVIRAVDMPGRTCVVTDRCQAFGSAVQWLADRGHRRIAFLSLDLSGGLAEPFGTGKHKFTGYRDAMQRLGFYDEELVVDCGHLPNGAVRRFVREHRSRFEAFTAILAANDHTAVEAMSGLADLGLRVPEDVSVIGFDNTEFAAAVRPGLTTFHLRRDEIGAKAAEMVLDLIDGKAVKSVAFVPRLVERESAGPCRRD